MGVVALSPGHSHTFNVTRTGDEAIGVVQTQLFVVNIVRPKIDRLYDIIIDDRCMSSYDEHDSYVVILYIYIERQYNGRAVT